MGALDKNIDELDAATSLTGTELVEVLQGGVNKRTTSQEIADLSSGSSITISIASANGFAGTSTSGSSPIITLTTTATGLLKGNGAAISAAVANTDYTPAVMTTAGDVIYGGASGAATRLGVGSNGDIMVVISGSPAWSSTVGGATITEISYVSGVTSGIQNQINNIASGLAWKASVRVATTANITLSSTQTIDGVSVIAGDRVLVKNQTTGSQNGLYLCAAGAWTRTTDADTGTKMKQATTSVEEGTVNSDTIFTCTNNGSININTTSLTFAKTSATTYTGSNGVILTGNDFSLDNSYITGAITLVNGVATLALVSPTKGGTGVVNNDASTFTITGGAFPLLFSLSASTSLSLPTTGTLYGTATNSITSLELKGSISDETGSGALVFSTSPTLVTPILGVAAATSINKVILTAPATSATITIADGKTATINNTITLAGTDATTITLPTATSTVLANNLGLSGGSTIISGTAVGDKMVLQATSNATHTAAIDLITLRKNSAAAASTSILLKIGDGQGLNNDEVSIYTGNNSGTNGYLLRAGATFAYFNASSSLRFQILGSDIIQVSSSTATMVQGITISDAKNITTNSTTGTKFGNGGKIGLFTATPIAQPTTAIAASTFVANTSLIANDTATFDGYTIGQIVKALRNIGALA